MRFDSGVWLAVAIARFHGWTSRLAPADLVVLILVVAYTMRRLPYTVRACYPRCSKSYYPRESAQTWAPTASAPSENHLAMLAALVAGGLIAFVTSCVEWLDHHAPAAHRIGPISLRHLSLHAEPSWCGAGARWAWSPSSGFPRTIHPPVFGARAGNAFACNIKPLKSDWKISANATANSGWFRGQSQIQAGDFFTFLGPAAAVKPPCTQTPGSRYRIQDHSLDDQEVVSCRHAARHRHGFSELRSLRTDGLKTSPSPARAQIPARNCQPGHQALAPRPPVPRVARPSQLSGGQQQRVALARIRDSAEVLFVGRTAEQS